MNNPTWDAANVVIVTDDELVALAAATESKFWGRVVTVEVDDPTELGRAEARGRRSLAVRGFLTEGVEPVSLLQPLLSCLGLAPWALASRIDEEARLAPDSSLLLVFNTDDQEVVWRSDPTGTHVVAPVTRELALGLLTDQLAPTQSDQTLRTAVTLANADGRGMGGFIRSSRGVVQVDNSGVPCGDVVESIGAAEIAALQAHAPDAHAS